MTGQRSLWQLFLDFAVGLLATKDKHRFPFPFLVLRLRQVHFLGCWCWHDVLTRSISDYEVWTWITWSMKRVEMDWLILESNVCRCDKKDIWGIETDITYRELESSKAMWRKRRESQSSTWEMAAQHRTSTLSESLIGEFIALCVISHPWLEGHKY